MTDTQIPNTEQQLENFNNDPDINKLRNSLVDTAVKFLASPKVSNYDDQSKIKFLEKKGMTMDEIELAMARALSINKKIDVETYPDQRLILRQPMLPPAIPAKNSYSSAFQSLAHFIMIFSSLAVGFHYVYKNYLGPFLTGKKHKSNEDIIIDVQQSVKNVLEQIHTTLERMDKNISEHNHILKDLKMSEKLLNEKPFLGLEELKSEISIMKGLLINRKSFPASPAVIPSWQMLTTNQEEETKDIAPHETTHNDTSKETNNADEENESDQSENYSD